MEELDQPNLTYTMWVGLDLNKLKFYGLDWFMDSFKWVFVEPNHSFKWVLVEPNQLELVINNNKNFLRHNCIHIFILVVAFWFGSPFFLHIFGFSFSLALKARWIEPITSLTIWLFIFYFWKLCLFLYHFLTMVSSFKEKY